MRRESGSNDRPRREGGFRKDNDFKNSEDFRRDRPPRDNDRDGGGRDFRRDRPPRDGGGRDFRRDRPPRDDNRERGGSREERVAKREEELASKPLVIKLPGGTNVFPKNLTLDEMEVACSGSINSKRHYYILRNGIYIEFDETADINVLGEEDGEGEEDAEDGEFESQVSD